MSQTPLTDPVAQYILSAARTVASSGGDELDFWADLPNNVLRQTRDREASLSHSIWLAIQDPQWPWPWP